MCCTSSCPPFLENVSEHLQIQGLEVQDSHKVIVKDLAGVRHQAQDIYQKIGKWLKLFCLLTPLPQAMCLNILLNFLYSVADLEHSMVEFLQYQDQASDYYTDLMNKLERMNGTLGGMLHYLDNMQSRIEDRLHMIQGYLGWAGDTTATVVFCLFVCFPTKS